MLRAVNSKFMCPKKGDEGYRVSLRTTVNMGHSLLSYSGGSMKPCWLGKNKDYPLEAFDFIHLFVLFAKLFWQCFHCGDRKAKRF